MSTVLLLTFLLVAEGAPALFSPLDGQKVSPFALHFKWFEPGLSPLQWWEKLVLRREVKAYELEVARDKEFRECVLRERVRAGPFRPGACEAVLCGGFVPEKPLPPGRYFWRVREEGGPWSEVRSFEVVDGEFSPKPAEISPTSEKPLFIFPFHLASEEEGEGIVDFWRALPEEIRGYCALHIGYPFKYRRACPPERFLPFLLRVLSLAEREGIPIFVNLSLSLSEYLLSRFSCVKGLLNCEVARKWVNRPMRRRILFGQMMLCAKYGKLFVWREPYWGFDVWNYIALKDGQGWRLIERYGRNVALLWKMNSHHLPLLYQSHLLGWWLCGVISAWGISAENWYWKTAGYGRIGEQFPPKRGKVELFPPTMLGVEFLLGVPGGGSVYYMETSGLPNHPFWVLSLRLWFPLIREVLETRSIPSRAEVLELTKVACLATGPGDGNFEYWERTPFNALFEGTYGLRLEPNTHEMTPNTGRFFIIPIIPPQKEEMAKRLFRLLVRADRYDAPGFRRVFEAFYPPQEGTEATLFQYRNHALVLPTWENKELRERFEIRPKVGPVRAIRGFVYPYQYLLFTFSEAGIRAHAYRLPPGWTIRDLVEGRRMSPEERERFATEFEIKVKGSVKVRSRPPSALLPLGKEGEWLKIRLAHDKGAVTVWVLGANP